MEAVLATRKAKKQKLSPFLAGSRNFSANSTNSSSFWAEEVGQHFNYHRYALGSLEVVIVTDLAVQPCSVGIALPWFRRVELILQFN